MLERVDSAVARPFPQLSGRVSDLQARVREHTAHRMTPDELVAQLQSEGLTVDVDTTGPGGRPLVRVDDDDIALMFDATDGALVIVDVRRHTHTR